MVNNSSNVMIADDSLLNNRLKKWSAKQHGSWLTDCCWNAFLWLESLVPSRFLNNGCKPMLMRNMLRCPEAWIQHPKKGEPNDSMRWIMVIRGQQREQAVGLVSSWYKHSWDCRRLHWRTGWSRSTQVMGIFASGLSPVCHRLYRLLGSLWGSATEQTTSSRW